MKILNPCSYTCTVILKATEVEETHSINDIVGSVVQMTGTNKQTIKINNR